MELNGKSCLWKYFAYLLIVFSIHGFDRVPVISFTCTYQSVAQLLVVVTCCEYYVA